MSHLETMASEFNREGTRLAHVGEVDAGETYKLVPESTDEAWSLSAFSVETTEDPNDSTVIAEIYRVTLDGDGIPIRTRVGRWKQSDPPLVKFDDVLVNDSVWFEVDNKTSASIRIAWEAKVAVDRRKTKALRLNDAVELLRELSDDEFVALGRAFISEGARRSLQPFSG